MNIKDFADQHNLVSKKEIEKVAYLAFLHFETLGQTDFSPSEVRGWFSLLYYSEPNLSRLAKNLSASSDFIRGDRPNSFRLHARRLKALRSEIPELRVKSVEVVSDGSILPDTMLEGKRTYIQRFGRQINAAYLNNIFDGCAVLMRRMVEICLIHTYENSGIEAQIKNGPDTYKDLRDIIRDALNSPTINLTKDGRSCLDEFRQLGNLSAHQLFYNCKIEEIDRVKLKFRLLVEELFNKAGKKVEK